MNEGGDKMMTNAGAESATRTKTKRSRAKKKLGPFLKVKFASAVVPIYRTESNGGVRYTLSFYRDGRRMRKAFNDLDSAKKEALFVAQRIQSGMQHVTDLITRGQRTCKNYQAVGYYVRALYITQITNTTIANPSKLAKQPPSSFFLPLGLDFFAAGIGLLAAAVGLK